jgi:hypothetical protein
MAHALQWVLLGLAAVWCAPSAVFLACIALGGLARGHDTQNGCAATPAERLSRKKTPLCYWRRRERRAFCTEMTEVRAGGSTWAMTS